MDQDRISQRAYALWEDAGRRDGAHEEHWQQACREIEAEDSQASSGQMDAAATVQSPGPTLRKTAA